MKNKMFLKSIVFELKELIAKQDQLKLVRELITQAGLPPCDCGIVGVMLKVYRNERPAAWLNVIEDPFYGVLVSFFDDDRMQQGRPFSFETEEAMNDFIKELRERLEAIP